MKINGKKIEDFLADKNIIKIYAGKDNWCRCGCGGNYYYHSEYGFATALKEAFQRCNSMRESSKLVQENFGMREPEGKSEGYINIPMVNMQRPQAS